MKFHIDIVGHICVESFYRFRKCLLAPEPN